MVLMRIYGELGRTARFPKCPDFLINSGLSRSYFASILLPFFFMKTEFAHDKASRFGHHCMGSVR